MTYNTAHIKAIKTRHVLPILDLIDYEKSFIKKRKRKVLQALLDKVNLSYEDRVYRFYHQSFKVYALQSLLVEIESIFLELNPSDKLAMNAYFVQLLNDAKSVGEWKTSHNEDWLKYTRPILEAFFHAKYFLDMMVKYSEAKYRCPFESGQAAVLYLFYLR